MTFGETRSKEAAGANAGLIAISPHGAFANAPSVFISLSAPGLANARAAEIVLDISIDLAAMLFAMMAFIAVVVTAFAGT